MCDFAVRCEFIGFCEIAPPPAKSQDPSNPNDSGMTQSKLGQPSKTRDNLPELGQPTHGHAATRDVATPHGTGTDHLAWDSSLQSGMTHSWETPAKVGHPSQNGTTQPNWDSPPTWDVPHRVGRLNPQPPGASHERVGSGMTQRWVIPLPLRDTLPKLGRPTQTGPSHFPPGSVLLRVRLAHPAPGALVRFVRLYLTHVTVMHAHK